MSRKVQMRRVWREGHRRSPRISALDARKAQPSRPIPPVAQSGCSTNTTITSTSTSLVEHQQKKRRRLGRGEGPTSRTRAKKKRKLRPLQDVSSSPLSAQQDPKSSDEQDGEQTSHEELVINSDQHIVQSKDSRKHEDRVTNPGEPPIVPCALPMPEKRKLELILDILQRRDTYEIFAEPVDPNEVEDYYEIIKEPMDFGTMRAKLHEGMYSSLEHFEHDVFLISRNAMHFNSSSTIYFRQARAIDELAKKVFHVLKTNPKNFEFEFSGTRGRTSRRPKGEARSSTYNSSSKHATNSRSNSGSLSVSRKPMLSLASSMSNLKTAMQVVPWCSASGITAQSDTRDEEVPLGVGDGRVSISSEADRRSTYKPWWSILNDNYSIVSTIYRNSKLLMPVNQQDFGYCESLMLFVKDLGPTAQMIAQRKLNGWSTEAATYLNSASNWPGAPICKSYVTSSFPQWVPITTDTAITIKRSQNVSSGDRMDTCDIDKGERAHSGDRMQICGTSVEVVSHGNDRSACGAIRLEARSSNDMDIVGVSRSDNLPHKQSSRIPIGPHSFITNARDLNFSVAGLNNKDKMSTQLKLEKSKMDDKLRSSDSASKYAKSNVLEHRLSDNYRFSQSSWPLETIAAGTAGFDQTIGSMNNLSSQYLSSYDETIAAAPVASHELCGSTETEWTLKSSQTLTPVSPFTFDLPFLKTRLDQMNSLGQNRFEQQSSGVQGTFLARMNETYHDNHLHSSLDTQLANLALQL